MLGKLKTALRLIKNQQWDLLQYKFLKSVGTKNLVPPLPHWVVIEPINICNLKCLTCPTGAGKLKRPPRKMELEEFKKIIDEIAGYTKKVALFNYGEPFLNPHIIEMIKYAVKRGIFIKLSTNGEFFSSPDFCRQVIESGVQYLIISLDGADQETISQFRPNSNFENIVKGCKNIVKAKKQFGKPNQKIELQFIVMKHNEHQKEAMRKFAKGLGVDIFKEKSVGLDVNDPEFQYLAQRYIPHCSLLKRYEREEGGKFKLKGEVPNFCSLVYSSALINADGSVVPCCYDYNGKYVMGNVFEQSLRSIWRGKEYQNFRRSILRDRGQMDICNSCPVDRIDTIKIKQQL